MGNLPYVDTRTLTPREQDCTGASLPPTATRMSLIVSAHSSGAMGKHGSHLDDALAPRYELTAESDREI
jgi:hypothetical protein